MYLIHLNFIGDFFPFSNANICRQPYRAHKICSWENPSEPHRKFSYPLFLFTRDFRSAPLETRKPCHITTDPRALRFYFSSRLTAFYRLPPVETFERRWNMPLLKVWYENEHNITIPNRIWHERFDPRLRP